MKTLAQSLLLAAAYYLAARLGLQLAFADTNVTPVWPPSGIAFAALYLYGLRLAPAVALGAFAANLLGFQASGLALGPATWAVSAAIALGNTCEALAGSWLLARVAGPVKPLAQIQNVYKFGVIAALVCAFAGALGSSALLLGGMVPPALQWSVFNTWWLGDLAGMLIVAPALIAWRGARPIAWSPRLVAETTLTAGLLALLLYLLFYTRPEAGVGARWTAYLLLPAVGWAAYRHGARGASMACVLIAAVAVAGTIRGSGPLAAGTRNDTLIAVQTFVALTSLIGLVLCADMSELRRRRAVGRMERRLAAHWSTLFAGMALTLFVWHMVATDTERRARAEFDVAVAGVAERIAERMQTYEQALRSTRALFAASSKVERAEWGKFIAAMGIAHNFPGIEAMGFAPMVTPSQRAAMVAGVRAEGFPDYSIRPEGERDRYLPIVFIEPFHERNRRAFGFDMLSEPVRRLAIERAASTGEPALSGRVVLIQDAGATAQAGFLMYVPVYERADTEAPLLGMVYSPFRMSDLMEAILGQHVPAMTIEVFDGAGTGEAARMYSSGARSAAEQAAYPNPLVRTAEVALPAHRWTLRLTSRAAFESTIDRQKSHIVLLAGSVISLLFFALVRGLSARQELAAALAADMGVALARSEHQFETLVDSAVGFAIIATSLDGTIRVFSKGAEALLGYRAEDMVDKRSLPELHLAQEIAARGRELAAELQQPLSEPISGFDVFAAQARRAGAEAREWTYVHRDGSPIPVSLVMTAIRDREGALSGYLSVAHDITRQQFLQRSLVAARDQAEAASQAKSEFVANMSHEIRTPMNAVLGVTHLLGRTALSVDQRNYLDMIRSAGQSLLGILNDVLDFSKIEAGRMELSPVPFTLDGVLDTLASIMTVYGAEKELELAICAEPDVPRALLGDAMRLQQVLSNLVSNAIKFTYSGEVTVHVALAGLDGDQARIVFTVSDSGIGMDSSQQARLFSPFTQADASMTRRFGGTGLGLTISRRLAELMGGTIEVDSAIGQGSRFRVALPLQVAERTPLAKPAARRILVVDDSATSRAFVSTTLRGWHWEVDCVASGAEARAQAARARYDAALVDWQMPGMDGLATMQALREAGAHSALPVLIMVSAFARARLIEEPSTGQASAILLKPVTATSLLAALETSFAAAPGAADTAASTGAPTPQRLDGARILLVEDNELNQLVARGILEAAGAQVEVAGDGAQALARLEGGAEADVILMDVQMPVMDGLSATRAIRGRLKLSVPILAMSAGVMSDERAGCEAAGMNDFIAKPIEVTQMLDVIARHLPARAVFDAGSLLKLSQANPAQRAALLALLEKVLRLAPQDLRAARAACAAGQYAEAAKLLHGLRGSVGLVAAPRFVQAALDLEAAMQEGAPCAALFDAAEQALGQTVAAGQRWLAQDHSLSP